MEATNHLLEHQQLEQWHKILEKILQDYANLTYRYGDINHHVIISRDLKHFMLVHEGWENNCHVYGTIVHAEIRNGKIWIHYDGTEEGITDELVAADIPKNSIVLAFHPHEVRQHTGYAVV